MNFKTLIAGGVFGFLSFQAHAKGMGGTNAVAYAAAEQGDVARLRQFFAADTNWMSLRNGLLRTAALSGQKEAVEFLISQGANVNEKGSFDMAPLARMALYGTRNDKKCAEVATVLIAHGAEVDPVDQYQSTPLLRAVELRKPRLALVLLEHGASQFRKYVGSQSVTAPLPLHMAVSNGDQESVAALLKFNPPLEAVNADAQSPLILSESLDRTEISRMLRQAMGDTNSFPTRAEMRVLGKRLAGGEMSLEEMAKVAIELSRTFPSNINLPAYVPWEARSQLMRGRLGAAFVVVGDEAIKGNVTAFQVLKQCYDPKKPLTWCSEYGLTAFSRLAAAGNKEALEIVLQYDIDPPTPTNRFIWTDNYVASKLLPTPRTSPPSLNRYLLAPAAANIEPAVDSLLKWLSTVKPNEVEDLAWEATNSLASAAAKGNQQAQAALEKLIAGTPKRNE